jgi:LacI family transcriptional regulator
VPKVVLLIESSRSSGRSLLRGIAQYARLHGPWAFYWEPGGLEKAWPQLKTLGADGIILRDVETMDDILAYGLPAVVVGHSKREIPGLANVITDSLAIGTMAAEHLLTCGFRQFAYCGFENIPWSVLRGESFSQRLAKAGYATHFCPPEAAREQLGWQREQALAEWLKVLPKPLGVMACNDDRGEQVIEACKLAGLEVPDQVGVIGADNDELVCELSDPPLSSVMINFERAGYESAEVLDRLMRRRSVRDKKILVPATHIIPRRSTDFVAVSDRQVAGALRFIRDHARAVVAVPEVARAAGLSRRVLEKRFRHLLRRSVLQEIRRVRVDQICRMLVETNESISQIGLALGYAGTEHLARYFRQETHMTPLAYRRKYGAK